MSGGAYVHTLFNEPILPAAVIGGLSVLLFLVSGDSVASAPRVDAANKKKQ